MSDVDERVTRGLRDLAQRVPLRPELWTATMTRVVRHRRRRRLAAGVGGLAVLAATALLIANLTGSRAQQQSVRVQAISYRLPDGTALLAARGRLIEALDAHGHAIKVVHTLQQADGAEELVLTSDHRTLWYVSDAPCSYHNNERVVRVDLATGVEHLVTSAVAIAVSPDGTRLALSRRAQCNGDGAATERLFIHNLLTNEETELVPGGNTRTGLWSAGQISWAPSGDQFSVVLRDVNESSRAYTFTSPRRGDVWASHEIWSPAHQPPTGLVWTRGGLVVSHWDASRAAATSRYYVERNNVRLSAPTEVAITGVEASDTQVYVTSGASGAHDRTVFTIDGGSLKQLPATAEAFTAT